MNDKNSDPPEELLSIRTDHPSAILQYHEGDVDVNIRTGESGNAMAALLELVAAHLNCLDAASGAGIEQLARTAAQTAVRQRQNSSVSHQRDNQ